MQMRWFYAFLLVLAAWGGFMKLGLQDSHEWQTWERPR